MNSFLVALICIVGCNIAVGIKWNNCGSDTDPVQVHEIDVTPHPIKVKEVANISVSFSTSVDVLSPIKLDLIIEREFLGRWVKIPCLLNLGSCTYDDACMFIPKYCPSIVFSKYCILQILPSIKICNCPLPQGDYQIPPTDLGLSQIQLPSYLEEGNYRITGNAYDSSSKRLICLQLFPTLSK